MRGREGGEEEGVIEVLAWEQSGNGENWMGGRHAWTAEVEDGGGGGGTTTCMAESLRCLFLYLFLCRHHVMKP